MRRQETKTREKTRQGINQSTGRDTIHIEVSDQLAKYETNHRKKAQLMKRDTDLMRCFGKMKIWSKLLARRRTLFNFAIPSVLVVILFALASTPAYADTVSSSYDASREYSKTITVDNTDGVVDLNKGNDDDKGDKKDKDDKDDKKDDKKDKDDKGDADASTNVLIEPVWSSPTPLQLSPESKADEAMHLKYGYDQCLSRSPITITNSSEESLDSIPVPYSYTITTVIDAFPVLAQNAPLYINESLATLQEWTKVFLQQLPSEMRQEVDKLLLVARDSVG